MYVHAWLDGDENAGADSRHPPDFHVRHDGSGGEASRTHEGTFPARDVSSHAKLAMWENRTLVREVGSLLNAQVITYSPPGVARASCLAKLGIEYGMAEFPQLQTEAWKQDGANVRTQRALHLKMSQVLSVRCHARSGRPEMLCDAHCAMLTHWCE